MIKVTFYNNGYEINGHSRPDICGEVSIIAWACINSIYKVDDTAKYYTSQVDNKENPNEGYTWATFDTTNKKAVWLFEQLKHNLRQWAEDVWGIDDYAKTQVQFEEVQKDLIK